MDLSFETRRLRFTDVPPAGGLSAVLNTGTNGTTRVPGISPASFPGRATASWASSARRTRCSARSPGPNRRRRAWAAAGPTAACPLAFEPSGFTPSHDLPGRFVAEMDALKGLRERGRAGWRHRVRRGDERPGSGRQPVPCAARRARARVLHRAGPWRLRRRSRRRRQGPERRDRRRRERLRAGWRRRRPTDSRRGLRPDPGRCGPRRDHRRLARRSGTSSRAAAARTSS